MIISHPILPELGKLFRIPAAISSFTLGFVGCANFTMAQVPTVTIQTQPTQAKIFFVNPRMGDDKTGNGSENSPWKTITQALQLASTNSVIMLSPGTYSTNTGEVFPLILRPGLSIQGNKQNQGKDVKIIGGGEYLSRSFGGENVAIVGANRSSLDGVTVSNPYSRGYGLWIESTNPVVQYNTFTNNTQDGIAISGSGTPSISKNYFYQNGANGVTISGNARPEIRDNIFQRTGFGINIVDNAAPVVVANQIQENRTGIVLQANCHPVLRNNLIQDSQEDGLVVIAQAIPDLGSDTDPGRNEFRHNLRYDINAIAAKKIVTVGGNYLDINHITANVDINGMGAPLARSTESATSSTGTEIIFTPPIPQLPPQRQSSQPEFNYVKVKPAAPSGVVEFVAPQASP